MTGRSALFNLFYFVLLILSVSAQTYENERINILFSRGLEHLKNIDYTRATADFDTLAKEFPNRALGNVYKAGIFTLKEYDYLIPINPDTIFYYLDKAQEVAETNYDEEPEKLVNVYELALVLGMKGYYYALEGNYFSALTEGISSLQYFGECLQIDTTCYDAYVAIGSYKYWKSEFGESLLWLPFVEDERAEGEVFLLKAINNNSFHSYVAVHSLTWAYLLSERDAKAVTLLENIVRNYPNNRTFAMLLGRAYFNIDKNKSIYWYNIVLDSYRKSETGSKIREIELLNKIAVLYEILDKNTLALECCNNILEYTLNDFEQDFLSARLERVVELKKKILSKL